MIFKQKKVDIKEMDQEIFKDLPKERKTGYVYEVEDIFGEIMMVAFDDLEGNILDQLVQDILKKGIEKGVIIFKLPKSEEKLVIVYSFKKNIDWIKEDENEEIIGS